MTDTKISNKPYALVELNYEQYQFLHAYIEGGIIGNLQTLQFINDLPNDRKERHIDKIEPIVEQVDNLKETKKALEDGKTDK